MNCSIRNALDATEDTALFEVKSSPESNISDGCDISEECIFGVL